MSEAAPQDKREQAKAVMDAVNKRDFETLAEVCDAEFEFHSVIAGLEGDEVYVGIEGMRKWAAGIDVTWEDFQAEIVEFREAGDEQAVVVTRNTGKAKESGVPLDIRIGMVWTWRNGKPWRNESWTDVHRAFEAAGLSE